MERIRPETEFKAIAVALDQQIKDLSNKKDKMLEGQSFGRKWLEMFKFKPSMNDILKGIFKFFIQ